MIKGMEDEKKIISDDWIGRSQSIVCLGRFVYQVFERKEV